MKLIRYFRHTDERALAVTLVEQLAKDLPSTLVEKRRKLLSVNKVTRLLERTNQLAFQYQQTHKIGFIKRAVLANTFKWGLKEKGYPEDFVEMATEALVVTLAKKSGTAPSP